MGRSRRWQGLASLLGDESARSPHGPRGARLQGWRARGRPGTEAQGSAQVRRRRRARGRAGGVARGTSEESTAAAIRSVARRSARIGGRPGSLVKAEAPKLLWSSLQTMNDERRAPTSALCPRPLAHGRGRGRGRGRAQRRADDRLLRTLCHPPDATSWAWEGLGATRAFPLPGPQLLRPSPEFPARSS